jgi:copper resistance protein D
VTGLLAGARALHFAAAVSLAGVFLFDCLIACPAWRRAGAADARFARAQRRLAWASLALALVSGAVWLAAVGSEMSGRPLAAVLSQGVVGVVLTRTRFGADWLVRLGLAVLIGLCLIAPPRWSAIRWAAAGLATAMLASLAWAGHGAATPGSAGDLHLAADIVHLAAAGLWLGTLLPLSLFLSLARRRGDAGWIAAARIATRRYSLLAVASVLALLAGGLVNTWFLAGTVPALVGTEYGRLLLLKIALFVAMLLIAAVNLRRLGPRLAGAAAPGPTLAQLRRNGFVEAALGLGVLAVVGILGILPPGLHEEPGWPFPFRIDVAALSRLPRIGLAILAVFALGGAVGAVAAAAAGHYRRSAVAAAGVAMCLAVAILPLRPAVEPAYPTSFYAPAEPYAAPSIARGARVYAENCALCHGAGGRGDGPAAAQLPVRPADLTAPHLFAHSPGDLFWWVGHGSDDHVMPGFAAVLSPDRRWDAINFVRARAAGVLAGAIGPAIGPAAAPPLPDFAFATGGRQGTLRRELQQGPVLLVLFGAPAPKARLVALAAAAARLQRAGLRILAADTQRKPEEVGALPFVVGVSREAAAALALFRTRGDGGETELLLDRGGGVRARWTAGGAAAPARLIADAERVARFPAAAPSHAGHAH